MDYSLRAKSEAFQCEILVHSWSPESEFDRFDHYKNGKVLKQRKIAYNDKNRFDWNILEFSGHVGEYDESVDGEQSDEAFMAALRLLGGELEAGDQTEEELDEEELIENLMAQYRAAFEAASEDEIIATAKSSIIEFIQESDMHTPERVFQAMVIAAKIGIATKTGLLNAKEKRITDAEICSCICIY